MDALAKRERFQEREFPNDVYTRFRCALVLKVAFLAFSNPGYAEESRLVAKHRRRPC